jgi:hypothetical protein
MRFELVIKLGDKTHNRKKYTQTSKNCEKKVMVTLVNPNISENI